MAITSLRITDFRNLAAVELSPCLRGLNIICGDNGSGKTSLLEAIHYLGLGRSFRSAAAARLIRHTTSQFAIVSQLMSDAETEVPVGILRDIHGVQRLRIAEKEVASISELAYFLPLRVINSQSHHLFESGPVFRRQFLDWGLFYQKERFLLVWRHFERALKQRNAVLRDQRPKKELDIWTETLIKAALELDSLRREYVEAYTAVVLQTIPALLAMSNMVIRYQPGWDEDQDYAALLRKDHAHAYSLGYTPFGPHRADLDITFDGIPVKHFLSRGQQKLLICAMMVAQGMLLATSVNKGLIYLVDDLPAELDLHSREKLISLLAKQQTQIFITAIQSETICDFTSNNLNVPTKVFHVEHGSLVGPPITVG